MGLSERPVLPTPPRETAARSPALQRSRILQLSPVHFVCPKPEDLVTLMNGWMRMMENLRDSKVDPVCAAAAASFGFVFLHPFEDGNGRIHRFLIHQQLACSGFTPHHMLFPVSAVMMRDRNRYDDVLEGFSQSIAPYVDYELHEDGSLVVN